MNTTNSHRPLRIEPLETRSLLAGNLFDGDDLTLDLFSNDSSGQAARDNADQNRTQEVQSGVPGDSGRANQSPDPSGRTDVARNIVQSPNTNVTQQVFLQAVATPEPAADPTPRPSNLAVDTALSALLSADEYGVTDNATDNALGSRVEVAETFVAKSFGSETGQESPSTSFSTTETLGEFRADANSFDAVPSDPDSGLIELSPLQPEFSRELSRNDNHPWQLDSAILPKIRSVIEQSSNARHEVVDAIIANWIGGNAGAGGMIALDQIVLPQTAFNTAFEWIDVQLESDLKLHRSIGMIAGGAATPLSDEALDAIMTTLSEAAESQVQPIKGIQPIEVPKIAYPAIAVLTAVAIASRRKSKHPDPATPLPPQHS